MSEINKINNLFLEDVDARKRIAILENYFDRDSAEFHNAIKRGKDITCYVTDGTLFDRLHGRNGFRPYEDIFVEDFWKMSRPISAKNPDPNYQMTGSQYVTIAGIDSTRYNGDNTSLDFPQLVMVAGQGKGGTQHFGRSRMNPTHTTSGGYVNSELHQTVLGNETIVTSGSTADDATINQQLYAEFGSHLVTTRELLSNAMDSNAINRFGNAGGASSGWAWYSCQSVLLSEVEVFGSTVWSSSGYDTGTAKMQLPLFESRSAINNRNSWYWLKDVASASCFCGCYNYGYAGYGCAGYSDVYVRPRFCLS